MSEDYTLYTLPGEGVIKYQESKWQYMSKRYSHNRRTQVYYHIDCDSVVDDNGHCLICGQPSPCAI